MKEKEIGMEEKFYVFRRIQPYIRSPIQWQVNPQV